MEENKNKKWLTIILAILGATLGGGGIIGLFTMYDKKYEQGYNAGEDKGRVECLMQHIEISKENEKLKNRNRKFEEFY